MGLLEEMETLPWVLGALVVVLAFDAVRAFSEVEASVLATSTAFLLFFIYSLDKAYSGQLAVPPEAFERVLKSFQSHG